MLVVKIGGELALEPRHAELDALVGSVRSLHAAGRPLVVVHGGGPQTSALMRRLGLEPTMVAGQRVTDEATLQCMIMAVGGEVNARLTAALVRGGVPAVGISGAAGGCIQCARRPPRVVSSAGGASVDYGQVGEITSVDRDLLDLLINASMVPLVACIGLGEDGALFNVNGDTVAAELASALRADALVLVTGTSGILRDKDDPTSRVARLDLAEAEQAIASGRIAGGMIAKVEEAGRALTRGVARVHVLGALTPGALEQELERPGSRGTVLRP